MKNKLLMFICELLGHTGQALDMTVALLQTNGKRRRHFALSQLDQLTPARLMLGCKSYPLRGVLFSNLLNVSLLQRGTVRPFAGENIVLKNKLLLLRLGWTTHRSTLLLPSRNLSIEAQIPTVERAHATNLAPIFFVPSSCPERCQHHEFEKPSLSAPPQAELQVPVCQKRPGAARGAI